MNTPQANNKLKAVDRILVATVERNVSLDVDVEVEGVDGLRQMMAGKREWRVRGRILIYSVEKHLPSLRAPTCYSYSYVCSSQVTIMMPALVH